MLAFLLHNVEEVWLDLPYWLRVHGLSQTAIWSEIDNTDFLQATALLTILFWSVYLLLRLKLQQRLKAFITLIGAAILGANSIGHLLLSMGTRSLMPGLVSSILLLMPICSVALWHCKKVLGIGWFPIICWIGVGFFLQMAFIWLAFTTLLYLKV